MRCACVYKVIPCLRRGRQQQRLGDAAHRDNHSLMRRPNYITCARPWRTLARMHACIRADALFCVIFSLARVFGRKQCETNYQKLHSCADMSLVHLAPAPDRSVNMYARNRMRFAIMRSAPEMRPSKSLGNWFEQKPLIWWSNKLGLNLE